MGDEPRDPGKERLLPGEAASVTSGDMTDVRGWVAVYSELYGFKEHLLSELDMQRQKVMAEGQSELDNDRKLLEREAQRLKGRLDFWKRELERRGRT